MAECLMSVKWLVLNSCLWLGSCDIITARQESSTRQSFKCSALTYFVPSHIAFARVAKAPVRNADAV